jgi:hypothetical protein
MASKERAASFLSLALSALATGQAMGSEQSVEALFSWNYPQPALASTTNQFVAGLITNKPAVATPSVPVVVLTNGVRRLGASSTNWLVEGIYKAVPYSMIVASPGPVADDNMNKPLHGPARMTIITPELRLVPLK